MLNKILSDERKLYSFLDVVIGVVSNNGCPYDHYTNVFYKNSHDPNLPNWYFDICSANRFKCKKDDKTIKKCWIRFFLSLIEGG